MSRSKGYIPRGGLTTAKLVKTARMSHPRVIGGIWVTQASIPTGISRRLLLDDFRKKNGHVDGGKAMGV